MLAAALVLVAAACGSSSKSTATGGRELHHRARGQQSIGTGEGAVSILAWPGYAENGSNDPKINWVKPFEAATGCKATVKYFGTSDEAFNLFKTGAVRRRVELG